MKARLANIKLAMIDAPQENHRTAPIDQDTLSMMTESVKTHGMLQPPRAKQKEDGRFELITGEVRCKAAEGAGLPDIPVLVVGGITDSEVLEQRIIENMAREDWTPYDRSVLLNAYKAANPGGTDEDLADRIGMSRTCFARNRLVEGLPSEFHSYFRDSLEGGKTLSATHAEILNGFIGRNRAVFDKLKQQVNGIVNTAYTEGMSCEMFREQLEKVLGSSAAKGKSKSKRDKSEEAQNAEALLTEVFSYYDDSKKPLHVSVRNIDDGNVELKIRCDEASLNSFIATLEAVYKATSDKAADELYHVADYSSDDAINSFDDYYQSPDDDYDDDDGWESIDYMFRKLPGAVVVDNTRG